MVGLIHPFERKTESPILSLAAETHSNGGIRSLNLSNGYCLALGSGTSMEHGAIAPFTLLQHGKSAVLPVYRVVRILLV